MIELKLRKYLPFIGLYIASAAIGAFIGYLPAFWAGLILTQIVTSELGVTTMIVHSHNRQWIERQSQRNRWG